MSTPLQSDLLSSPEPAPDVDDAFDGFGDAPPGSKVYLYTTNPRLTHGKRMALLTTLKAPLELLELQRTFGGGPYYAILHNADGEAIRSKRFALVGPPLLEQRLEPQALRSELGGSIWAPAPAAAPAPAPELLEVRELREQVRELAASVKLLVERQLAPVAPVQVLPPEDPLKARVTELLLDQLGVRQSGTVGGALAELVKARKILRQLEDEDREEKPGALDQVMPALLAMLAPALAGGRPGAAPAQPGQLAAIPRPGSPRGRVGASGGAPGSLAASRASQGPPAAEASSSTGTPLEPRWQVLVEQLARGAQLAAAGRERAARQAAEKVIDLGDVLLTDSERAQLAQPAAVDWLVAQLGVLVPEAAPALATEAGKNWLASVLVLAGSAPDDDAEDEEDEDLEADEEPEPEDTEGV